MSGRGRAKWKEEKKNTHGGLVHFLASFRVVQQQHFDGVEQRGMVLNGNNGLQDGVALLAKIGCRDKSGGGGGVSAT